MFFKKKIGIVMVVLFLLPVMAKANDRAIDTYRYYLKGALAVENKDFVTAFYNFKRVKSLDPNSVYIRLKLAYVLFNLKKIKDAENELKEAAKLDPENLSVSFLLTVLYSYKQDLKNFEKEYEKFLQLAYKQSPLDKFVAESLVQFYYSKKIYEKAIQICEEIIKAYPDYVEGFFMLGYLYEESGQRKKAIQIWEKALGISADYAPLLNSLGYIYAEEGINLDQAELLIKKALEQEPNNGAYLDSLGWVYFKKKQYAKAKKYLLKALHFLKDPVIYEHLGDLYKELNEPKKSLFYYQEGLKFFPQNTRLKEKLAIMYGEENKIPKK